MVGQNGFRMVLPEQMLLDTMIHNTELGKKFCWYGIAMVFRVFDQAGGVGKFWDMSTVYCKLLLQM